MIKLKYKITFDPFNKYFLFSLIFFYVKPYNAFQKVVNLMHQGKNLKESLTREPLFPLNKSQSSEYSRTCLCMHELFALCLILMSFQIVFYIAFVARVFCVIAELWLIMCDGCRPLCVMAIIS